LALGGTRSFAKWLASFSPGDAEIVADDMEHVGGFI